VRAQYLLRFDDLCPAMDRARWERFSHLIARFGIQPILAVVPDNLDPQLQLDLPYAGFWDEMQALDAAGATIGLHGYRHLCAVAGRSLIPLHKRSEFAGASREQQREWIGAGLQILRSKGLHPRIWVAPRHGFDLTTLEVLREQGIGVISDGFATRPFHDRGLIWIPQQLWQPAEKMSGLWTICIHSNSASDEDFFRLQEFLERFGDRFTSVERVLSEWVIVNRSLSDKCFHGQMLLRIGRSQVRRLIWHS
jgi:predicted deacetylase